jgi:hypothetical protein
MIGYIISNKSSNLNLLECQKFLSFYLLVTEKLTKNDNEEKKELLLLVRKLQKTNIMTLLYGLTYYIYKQRICQELT